MDLHCTFRRINPTFRIYENKKNPKTSLKRARLKHFAIAPASIPSIFVDNRITYQVRLDMNEIEENITTVVPIIVSLQEHTYGNFAIFRIDTKIGEKK